MAQESDDQREEQRGRARERTKEMVMARAVRR